MSLYNFICHIVSYPTIGSGKKMETIIKYSIYQDQCKDMLAAIDLVKTKWFKDVDNPDLINNQEVWLRVGGGIKVIEADNKVRKCDNSELIYQYIQILEFNENE